MAFWLLLLVCRSAKIRAEHEREIRAEVAELLRRGYDRAQLEASMQAQGRDRTEWPRTWRGRLKPPQRPATATETRSMAEILAERERLAAEASAARDEVLGGKTFEQAFRDRRKKGGGR